MSNVSSTIFKPKPKISQLPIHHGRDYQTGKFLWKGLLACLKNASFTVMNLLYYPLLFSYETFTLQVEGNCQGLCSYKLKLLFLYIIWG